MNALRRRIVGGARAQRVRAGIADNVPGGRARVGRPADFVPGKRAAGVGAGRAY